MTRQSLALCVGLVLVAGCEQSGDRIVYEAASQPASVEHYLLEDTTLRVVPTQTERVSDPNSDGDMPNWKGALRRGQRMHVEKRQGDWCEVRLDGDATGWLPGKMLLAREGLQEMVAMGDLQPLESAAGTPISDVEPVSRGSLLFVSSVSDGYVLANVGASDPVWLSAEKISQDKSDIAMAHIIIKARWSAQHSNLANNARLLDKARIKNPNSKLLDLVADQVPFADLSETPHLGTSAMEKEDESRQGIDVVKAASPRLVPAPESLTK